MSMVYCGSAVADSADSVDLSIQWWLAPQADTGTTGFLDKEKLSRSNAGSAGIFRYTEDVYGAKGANS